MATASVPASALAFADAFSDADTEFDAANNARARALRALQMQLQTAASDGSREAFCLAFARAQVVLELDDIELARVFQLSRPTVGRWTRGEAAPHPVGRGPILDALAKRATKKLKLLGKA